MNSNIIVKVVICFIFICLEINLYNEKRPNSENTDNGIIVLELYDIPRSKSEFNATGFISLEKVLRNIPIIPNQMRGL